MPSDLAPKAGLMPTLTKVNLGLAQWRRNVLRGICVALVTVFLLATPPVLADEMQTASLPPEQQASIRTLVRAAVVKAPDTPGGQSYLDIAREEADLARRQLLQASQLQAAGSDAVIQRVASAVHALDPRFGAAEGYSDYGMLPAMMRAIEGLRGGLQLLPGDVRLEEAIAGLSAAQSHIEEAVDLGRAALVTPSTTVAREAARAMLMALGRAVDGWDRNADGRISWQQGEAGLAAADEVVQGLAQALALR